MIFSFKAPIFQFKGILLFRNELHRLFGFQHKKNINDAKITPSESSLLYMFLEVIIHFIE